MYEVVIENIIRDREEARVEGMKKGLEKAARNLLANGADIDFVQKITGLDIDVIKGY